MLTITRVSQDIAQLYVEIALDINQNFYIWPSYKQIILLPNILANCIVNFAIYYPQYKKKLGMIKSTYILFLFRPSSKLITLLCASSDYIFKVFAAYHPKYKEKPEMTEFANLFLGRLLPKQLSLLGASSDCCGWINLSAAFFLAHNSSICTTQISLAA